MKPILFLSLSLSLVSLPAFAETFVYNDGEYLNASMRSEEESKALYEALQISPLQARSGKVKTFSTQDRQAVIYCTKSEIPVGQQYECRLSIAQPAGAGSDTPVFEENGFLHASVNVQAEAKALYEALGVEEMEGRSGVARFFYTVDRRASIYCTKSEISVDIPYGCRVSIQLPVDESQASSTAYHGK